MRSRETLTSAPIVRAETVPPMSATSDALPSTCFPEAPSSSEQRRQRYVHPGDRQPAADRVALDEAPVPHGRGEEDRPLPLAQRGRSQIDPHTGRARGLVVPAHPDVERAPVEALAEEPHLVEIHVRLHVEQPAPAAILPPAHHVAHPPLAAGHALDVGEARILVEAEDLEEVPHAEPRGLGAVDVGVGDHRRPRAEVEPHVPRPGAALPVPEARLEEIEHERLEGEARRLHLADREVGEHEVGDLHVAEDLGVLEGPHARRAHERIAPAMGMSPSGEISSRSTLDPSPTSMSMMLWGSPG